MSTKPNPAPARQKPKEATVPDNKLATRGQGQIATAADIQRLDGPISNVGALVERIKAMQKQAFICTPFTSLDLIPPNFIVSERMVVLSPNPDDRDVYTSKLYFKRDGEVGLAKNGILKIMQAAGGTVLWSKQVDDGSDPYYVEWSCMTRFRLLDGNFVEFPGSKRVNLRDNSPELFAMINQETGKVNEGQLRGARINIVSLAETKALLRAVRGALALKQGYLRTELQQKPFLCYALVANVDMSDPVTKHMAEAAALGIPMYGPGEDAKSTRALSAAPEEERTPEGFTPAPREQTGTSQQTQQPAQPAAKEPPPDDEAPPPEPDIFVCGCPCSHQVQLSEERYASSVGKIGSARCEECYPGQHFNFEMHKELGDLQIKELPGYTPEQARDRRAQILAAKR